MEGRVHCLLTRGVRMMQREFSLVQGRLGKLRLFIATYPSPRRPLPHPEGPELQGRDCGLEYEKAMEMEMHGVDAISFLGQVVVKSEGQP